MKFNIIGTGSLGRQLAIALINAKHKLIGICNKSHESADKFCVEIKKHTNHDCKIFTLDNLLPADVTFITVPDDEIQSVVSQLINKNNLLKNHYFIHCSGVLSSAVLSDLKLAGGIIASLHPLNAFPKNADLNPQIFNDLILVAEGDKKAVEILQNIFNKLRASVVSIQPGKKATYHAAAVFASNYIVTLAQSAFNLFTDSGLSDKNSRKIVAQLIAGNLKNLQVSNNFKDCLTGPLKRGDCKTIEKHIKNISDKSTLTTYLCMAQATLELTNHPEEERTKLNKLITEAVNNNQLD